jgi:hypothetical protein
MRRRPRPRRPRWRAPRGQEDNTAAAEHGRDQVEPHVGGRAHHEGEQHPEETASARRDPPGARVPPRTRGRARASVRRRRRRTRAASEEPASTAVPAARSPGWGTRSGSRSPEYRSCAVHPMPVVEDVVLGRELEGRPDGEDEYPRGETPRRPSGPLPPGNRHGRRHSGSSHWALVSRHPSAGARASSGSVTLVGWLPGAAPGCGTAALRGVSRSSRRVASGAHGASRCGCVMEPRSRGRPSTDGYC